jgi:AraC-like DNA-binding protein
VKYYNNLGNAGYFSKRINFEIREQAPKLKYLKDVFISEKPEGAPLSELKAGCWYYINVFLRNPPSSEPHLAWDSLTYLLIQLNDTNYLDGHIGNKGGKFLSASNYIINLSLIGKRYKFFEKGVENSFSSSPLPGNTAGLYVDARKENLLIDSSRQYIRCKFRLLEKANSGPWKLSAVVFYYRGWDSITGDKKNIPSNTIRKTLMVVNSGSNRLWTWFLLAAAFVFTAVVSAFILRRNNRPIASTETTGDSEKNETKTVEKDFSDNGLVLYLSAHLAESLTVDSVKLKLGLNQEQFKILLKRTGNDSFLSLLNSLRMEKAKELLAIPNLSVNTICGEVGFNDIGYFAKVFAKHTGTTPKKYQLSLTENKFRI